MPNRSGMQVFWKHNFANAHDLILQKFLRALLHMFAPCSIHTCSHKHVFASVRTARYKHASAPFLVEFILDMHRTACIFVTYTWMMEASELWNTCKRRHHRLFHTSSYFPWNTRWLNLFKKYSQCVKAKYKRKLHEGKTIIARCLGRMHEWCVYARRIHRLFLGCIFNSLHTPQSEMIWCLKHYCQVCVQVSVTETHSNSESYVLYMYVAFSKFQFVLVILTRGCGH
jgi:hypothetical protein